MDTVNTQTYTTQLELNVEDPAIVKTIKTLVRHMKGVMSVKEVKPRTKMSETEFYEKIETASKSAAAGNVYKQQEGESINDFVNRLLCTD